MPLSKLDTRQMEIATSSGDETAVSAGAGSGKTRLLVGRYLFLLKSHGVPMTKIVAITFTEKAAAQMKAAVAERARELAVEKPEDADFWKNVASEVHSAPISTIHSFCNSILRKYPYESGLDPSFTIIDDVSLSVLKGQAVEDFIGLRMEAEPEAYENLLGSFGLSGLRRMFHTMLSERARLITFLDSLGHPEEDEVDPEEVEKRYRTFLKDRLREFREVLTDFHALAPGDDGYAAFVGGMVENLSRLVSRCDENAEDVDFVLSMLDDIKKNARKGSPRRWEDHGLSLGEVKSGVKELRGFLEILESFYRNESGVTAKTTTVLLEEWKRLERYFLELKKRRSFLDHDDTLIETWRLLRNNANVLNGVSRTYRHILVDEFQDTDRIQMDILTMIAGNSSSPLFTVGDPKQSIYRFRGADVSVFNDFIAGKNVEFKSLKVNYRSAPAIIDFVNRVFGRIMGREEVSETYEAPYYDMKPHRNDRDAGYGVEIAVVEAENAYERRRREAGFIARRIGELKEEYGYAFRDMALLLRKGTRTRRYEEAFLARGIPYVNLTTWDPFRSPEAYDCANLLRWLCEPGDPVLFSAVLLSPFFGVAPEDLHGVRRLAGRAENMPSAFLYGNGIIGHEWFEGKGFERIREILTELLRMRDRMTVREILEYAFDETDYTLVLLADPVSGELAVSVVDLILDDADEFEKSGGGIREFSRLLVEGSIGADTTPTVEVQEDAVNIITIHKAKGMEYKVVFLADVADSSRGRGSSAALYFDDELGIGFTMRDSCGKRVKTMAGSIAAETERRKEIAESKRLFYVGCTRAKDHLIISGGKPQRNLDTTFEKGNWMGWLHAALGMDPEGPRGDETPDGLFKYVRISEDPKTAWISPADFWSDGIKGEESDGFDDAALDEAMTPLERIPVSGLPEHLTPTRILDYLECPAYYLYRYVHGVEPGKRGEGGDGYGERYGLLAHGILEKLVTRRRRGGHAGNGCRFPPEPHDEISLVFPPAGETIPESWRERLREELEAFVKSPLYEEIVASEEVRCEEPFAFILKGVLVRGTMDVLFRNGDEIGIVDYKTDTADGGDAGIVPERYRMQLGIYAYAVERAELVLPSRLVIHYLAPGVSRDVPCTREFLDEISAALAGCLEKMRSGDFTPRESEKCSHCPYSGLCDSGRF